MNTPSESGVHVLTRAEDLTECPVCAALVWNTAKSRDKHAATHHGKSNQS